MSPDKSISECFYSLMLILASALPQTLLFDSDLQKSSKICAIFKQVTDIAATHNTHSVSE